MAVSMGTRMIKTSLKQPTFILKAQAIYSELANFKMEVKNTFMTKSYDIADSERVPIIIKWPGHKGIHFIQTVTDEEQETCKVVQVPSIY